MPNNSHFCCQLHRRVFVNPDNLWKENQTKSAQVFFFLTWKTPNEEKKHPLEQHALIIMDTFKLCAENNYVVMIVPHNLTNKFLPLDLSVNMAANSFI